MSFISRLSDIMSANAHAVLDGCENPERMSRYVLRRMEEELDRARRQAASAIAMERSLGRELEQQRSQVEHWQHQASAALGAKREDLARQALLRKQELAAQIHDLQTQHAAALQTSDKVRADLQNLDKNLSAAYRRQRFLVARYRVAQARIAVGRSAADGLSTGQWRQLERQLEDLESTLVAEVDLLEPGEDIDRTLRRIEQEQKVEAELAELKRNHDAKLSGKA
jgi:phage shock protein A